MNIEVREYNPGTEEKKPIYEFTLNESGEIVRTRHDNYELRHFARINAGNADKENKTYIIYKPGERVYKEEKQMGRFLNNHLYSFDPDMDNARGIIIAAIEAKYEKAKKTADECHETLCKIKAAAET